MTVDMVIAIVFAVFFLLLACEAPVAFALAGSGALGITLLKGSELATSHLGHLPYSEVAKYSLAIIPMYILLGMFALHGRLAERLYSLGAILLRRLPGGLGIATVGACAGFAAVSGSSVATAASIGKISVHEMVKGGFRPHFAGGIVAIAGTLGILIPPSVAMVLYGVIAEESIAQLLVAGVVPGVLSAIVYSLYIAIRARALIGEPPVSLEVALAGASGGRVTPPQDLPAEAYGAVEAEEPQPTDTITTGQRVRAAVWIGLIFLTIVVGTFTGAFTVIESAAIGALVALVMLVSENFRNGAADLFRRLRDAVLESAAVTSMAFGLVVGAGVLSTFLVMARVPIRLTEWVVGLDVPPTVVILLILALLIPLGMFLETLSILVIVVPLVHPVVTELGYDGVWFGVLFVIMLEIGLVTPPVGMNTFVVSMTSGLRLESVFRGVTPFIFLSLLVVALIFVFPDLALWLPGLVKE